MPSPLRLATATPVYLSATPGKLGRVDSNHQSSG